MFRSKFFPCLFLGILVLFSISSDAGGVFRIISEEGDVFLKKDLSYILETVIENTDDKIFRDEDYYSWHKYLNSPHPSVATLEKYFESASSEFGVPVELLRAIGQVENNWTQIGPSIDRGWGIMHLVENDYCNTLARASELLKLPASVLKDDARQNIRGAAALLSEYADEMSINRLIIENWLEPLKKFSGLINDTLSTEQALRYYEILEKGVTSRTNWEEEIIIMPYYRKLDLECEYDRNPQKSSDYPPAIYDSSTASPNYSSRYGVDIDTWVNHWVGVGTYAGAISWFQHPDNTNSSAHFVIRASDGEISQCVLVEYSAWHCGASGYPDNNRRSIGVEHEATAANPDLWYSVPMLTASTDMARYFADLHLIPKERALPGIRGHKEMPGCSTDCPGNLPWDTWMAMLLESGGTSGDPFVVKVKPTGDGFLNVRSGPGGSYGIITEIYPGEEYVSDYYEDGWYRIHIPSGTGVSYGYSYGGTATDNGYLEGSQSTAIIRVMDWKGTLNVRSGPSTSYAIITTVTSGQRFAVVEESGGWYKFYIANLDGYTYGWASGSYLEYTAGGNRDGFAAEMSYITYPSTMESGATGTVAINILNTGSNSFSSSTILATTNPRMRNSLFYHSSWISEAEVMQAVKNCLPGQVTQYSFTVQAPVTENTVQYTEYFNLYQDGYAWFSDQGGPEDSQIYFAITVTGNPAYNPPLNLTGEIVNQNDVQLNWSPPGSKVLHNTSCSRPGKPLEIKGRTLCMAEDAGVWGAEIYGEPDEKLLGYTDSRGYFSVEIDSINTTGLKLYKDGYIAMTRKFYTQSQKHEFQTINMAPANPTEEQMRKIMKKYPLSSNSILDNEHIAKITQLPATRRVLMTDGSVVVMEMDEYLKGVVPKEVYTSWDQQALRAQAMAARCYAAITSKHNDVGADVCTTTCCQAWGPDHYASTDEAVEATSGHSLKYGGNIIQSVFFSHSNGYTKNNEDVWGGDPIAYLRSVPSPCGYDYYYGHGVGMAQWGSKNMADMGYTWQQIVCHYYTDIAVDYPVSSPTGYKVYRNGSLIATISSPGTLGYLDQDLADGQYSYTVTAVYDQEESDPSNAVIMNIESAVFYSVSLYADGSVTLSGAGDYEEGDIVYISAGIPEGYIFSEWSGPAEDTALLNDPYSSETYFIMPSRNVEFTALIQEDTSNYISAALSLEDASLSGIWQWTYSSSRSSDISEKGSSWVQILADIPASKIMAGDISDNGNLELVALLPGYGLWYYDLSALQWINIAGNTTGITEFTLAETAAGGPLQIIASMQENGIFKWVFNGSWSSISSMPADIMVSADINRDIDALDDLIIVFSGYSGLYLYDFATSTFSSILNISPSQVAADDITGDGYTEMVCVFGGFGIYLVRYLPSKNNNEGILESSKCFDLINDIPENFKWVPRGGEAKGYQFNRLTLGTPDTGHYVSSGDITAGGGAEVIFTYQNRTYYYSYDAKGWNTLVIASLKRIISGKFTGGASDDLIACETSTGSIYLRKSSTGAWELLAANADTNAGTAIQ